MLIENVLFAHIKDSIIISLLDILFQHHQSYEVIQYVSLVSQDSVLNLIPLSHTISQSSDVQFE